jgi:hypothetical protein
MKANILNHGNGRERHVGCMQPTLPTHRFIQIAFKVIFKIALNGLRLGFTYLLMLYYFIFFILIILFYNCFIYIIYILIGKV